MKNVFIVTILLIGFLTIQAGSAPLSAGVAKVNMTPPLELKYALGGYGDRMSKPAEGIHDNIWVKALALSNGEKKFVIVTLDIVGLPPNVKPQVVERLKADGWSLENVMLLSSHSHASLNMSALNDKNDLNIPQIGIFQPELLQFVLGKIVEAIQKAGQSLQPVKVGTASTHIEGMNRNRRGAGFTDTELTVTRIDRMTGKPLAMLVNWTAHPTFVNAEDMLVSGEWPGYLQRELEAWIDDGVTAMYYNGAEGDQAPTGAVGGSHYEQAEDYGRKIAIRAAQVYRGIEPKEDVVFDYTFTTISLPERQAHPDFMATGGAEYALDENSIKILLEKLVPSTSSTNAVRIGDLVIAGVPGEMASELGLQIKDALHKAGIPHPTIGGLANEWISYILPANEYRKGGYEASVSFYGPQLGETIRSAVTKNALALIKR